MRHDAKHNKNISKAITELWKNPDYKKKHMTGKMSVDEIKSYRKKYREKHKDEIKEYNTKYYKQNNEKIKKQARERMKKYYKTDIGKQKDKESHAKRKRNLSFIPLFNNPFPDDIDVDYHHINNLFVVPMPKYFHQKTYNNNTDEHRERSNIWLYYIYGIDFKKIINGEI